MNKPSDDGADENSIRTRSKAAFLLVNTLTWVAILGVPGIIVRSQLRLSRLNLDLLEFAAFAIAFSGIVGFLASLVKWKRIERQDLEKANRQLAMGN